MQLRLKKLFFHLSIRLVFIFPLFLSSCRTIPEYSIVVNGAEIASLTGDVSTSSNYTSDLENPIITGNIRTRPLTIETDSHGNIWACCSRSFIRTNGNYLLSRGNEAFLSITEPYIKSIESDKIYNYSTSPIILPANGETVQLSLVVESNTKITGNIKLADDVIVLPVHVHVFKREGTSVNIALSERNVSNWFDPPNIQTSAVTVRDPVTGELKTSLKTENVSSVRQIYALVDTIWVQAKIQFYLASYDQIVNDELESQIFSDNQRIFLPTAVHLNNSRVNGIHIYIGQNSHHISPTGSGLGIKAGQTIGPGCSDAVNRSYAIALAWDQARSNPSALAHELGHYLGLSHVDEPYSAECGSSLLDPSDAVSSNLMNSFGSRSAKLSTGQIARAREMACRYLLEWGISNSNCD